MYNKLLSTNYNDQKKTLKSPFSFQGTLLERKYKSKIEDETLKFIRQKRPRMQCKGRSMDGNITIVTSYINGHL